MLFGLYPEATVSPLTLMRSGLSVMGDVATIRRGINGQYRWLAVTESIGGADDFPAFSLGSGERSL